jgi:nucleoid DNA-binding protein
MDEHNETLMELPDKVRRHIEAVADAIASEADERAVERVAEVWFEKRRLFTEQTRALDMENADLFAADDPRGAVLLTYSASLIMVGPATEERGGGRSFEYASIKARTDVPELLSADAVRIARDIAVDQTAVFEGTALERSSEILRIATFPDGLDAAEQRERLRQAMVFLTNGFVHVNRMLTSEETEQPDQFTLRSVVRYIADRHGVTQVTARGIIDDYLSTVETGALLGRRVPLGSIGRLFLGVRDAQKARMGRNPATGAEILIPAKPKTAVPKISFSAAFKERAGRVPPERVRNEREEAVEDDQ